MKKTLITVGIVLLVTVFFIVIFHFTSGASDVSIENITEISSEVASEDNGEIKTDEDEDSYTTEEFDLKEYINERIAPVVAGVATAIFTIILALQPVITAVKAIRNMIKAFSNKDEERNESFKKSQEQMLEYVKRLESETKKIPALEEQVKTLVEVNGTLTEVLVLGFTSNADVVRSGRGKKMSMLLKRIPQSAELTAPFTSNDTQKLVFDSGIHTSDQSGVVKEPKNAIQEEGEDAKGVDKV